jgi:hypothetical protein
MVIPGLGGCLRLDVQDLQHVVPGKSFGRRESQVVELHYEITVAKNNTEVNFTRRQRQKNKRNRTREVKKTIIITR